MTDIKSLKPKPLPANKLKFPHLERFVDYPIFCKLQQEAFENRNLLYLKKILDKKYSLMTGIIKDDIFYHQFWQYEQLEKTLKNDKRMIMFFKRRTNQYTYRENTNKILGQINKLMEYVDAHKLEKIKEETETNLNNSKKTVSQDTNLIFESKLEYEPEYKPKLKNDFNM